MFPLSPVMLFTYCLPTGNETHLAAECVGQMVYSEYFSTHKHVGGKGLKKYV